MRRCVMPDNPEFSFHVHKLMALFTLAIWDGALLLRGICYAQPLDAALTALRKVLEERGREARGEELCRHSGSG